MKWLISLYLLFFNISCVTHFSRIYSNRPKAKKPSKNQKLSIDFKRIPEKFRENTLGIHNFNNASYDKQIQDSPHFFVKTDADILVEYSSKSEDLNIERYSGFLWFITLGAVPYNRQSLSRIKFKIYNNKQKKLLDTYEYKVRQASLFGWLSVPISLFVYPFADTVAEISNDQGLDMHERVVARFSRDFLKNRDEYLTQPVKNKTKKQANQAEEKKVAFLVTEGKNTHKDYKKQGVMIASLLETSLVKGSYTVRDTNNLKTISKEQALAQSGMTKQAEIQKIGELTGANKIITSNVIYYTEKDNLYTITVIIHITDVTTAEVEWKNLYSLTGKDIDSMFAKGSAKLLADLQLAGYR